MLHHLNLPSEHTPEYHGPHFCRWRAWNLRRFLHLLKTIHLVRAEEIVELGYLTPQPKTPLFWAVLFILGSSWLLLSDRLKCCAGPEHTDHLFSLVIQSGFHSSGMGLWRLYQCHPSAYLVVGVVSWPLQEYNRFFLTGGWLLGQMGALWPLFSHLWRGSAAGPEAVQQPHPCQWGQILRGSEGEIPILQPRTLPQHR